MLYRIKNNLQNKSIWWKSKLWLQRKIVFKFHSERYGIRFKARNEKISSVILRKSLGGILKTSLLAVVFVVATEYFSKLASEVNYSLGSEELGLLISTVVTVTGVFLGLYYTALSAIAGNLFMRAPESLQKLFLRDRKGVQYIRTLVLTTIIGLIYLLLRSFGYDVGFLGPILITVLAIYSVVRFMSLGAQTFYFIHPQEAASILTGDAAYAIDNSHAAKTGWKKDYLQNHYRKQAKEALETLNSLVDFGIDPVKLSGAQLRDIAQYTASLLDYYIDRKKTIPTDSKWFATKYEHKNWLLTQETELTMALNTGTSLQPKDVRDQGWFEDQCLDVIIKVLEYLIKTKQWTEAQLCLENIVNVAEKVGSNLYTDNAMQIVDKVTTSLQKHIIDMSNPDNAEDKQGVLAIIDSFGRLPIAVLISLNRYLSERNSKTLVGEIDQVRWNKVASIYTSKLPGSMLAEMEITSKSYKNEIRIEGKQISENWYLETITTQQYLRQLNKYYEYVKSLNDRFYKNNFEKLLKQQKIIQAAHVTDRWTEFTNKLLSLGWNVQQVINDCSEYKRIEDLPWTSINPETEKSMLQSINQTSIDKMAMLVMPLSLLPKNELEDLPDYFGQAYTFGVEAAYIAAMENDTRRLDDLFPSVFAGALQAYDKTRKEVDGWNEQSKILVSSEPLEDILTLSGFIKIYSELHNNQELWRVCEETWGSYLDSHSDPQAMIKMFAAFSSYRDAQLGILMPKAVLRTNWDTRLRQVFETRGINVDMLGGNPFEEEDEIPHESPLIQFLARRAGLLSAEARTVFFVTYLSKHEAVEGIEIDFPDRSNFEGMLGDEASNEGDDNNE